MRKHRGIFSQYRSYNFVNQDPIVDAVRTMVRDEGLREKDVVSLSFLSPGCVGNMLGGVTRSPRFTSIAALCSGMGYARIEFGSHGPHFVKTKDLDFERETLKARAEYIIEQKRRKTLKQRRRRKK